jgi:NAD(P)-dependent dehydrogenase (short-subunit alcohol dehydrogenase family)
MLQRVLGPGVVGATSGIGEAIAHQLADANATFLVAGRDPTKLARLAGALRYKSRAPVHAIEVDLADLGSIAAAAQAIRSLVPGIHILIANAGVLYMGKERQLTRDGFELTVGVNHLGNAALILALAEQLRVAAPSRVVILSSEAHRHAGKAPLDDLMGERNFSGVQAYSRSKLANLLFARELARRWLANGISVYAAHPGVVDTGLLNAFTRNRFDRFGLRVARLLFLSPERAAQGILRIAADPTLQVPSGSYFELGRPKPGSPGSNDPNAAARLWEMTASLLASVPGVS